MAQTRAFHRDALLPKPSSRTPFVPVIPHQDAGLARLLGDLVPEERRTLAEIVDRSDLLMVDGKPWLLVEATPGLVERLATFQAATEDLEPDLEDEGETDDDRDNDNPADQNGPQALRCPAAGGAMPTRGSCRLRSPAPGQLGARKPPQFCPKSARQPDGAAAHSALGWGYLPRCPFRYPCKLSPAPAGLFLSSAGRARRGKPDGLWKMALWNRMLSAIVFRTTGPRLAHPRDLPIAHPVLAGFSPRPCVCQGTECLSPALTGGAFSWAL